MILIKKWKVLGVDDKSERSPKILILILILKSALGVFDERVGAKVIKVITEKEKWLRKSKKLSEKSKSLKNAILKSKTLILRKQQFWSQKVISKEKAPNQNNKSPILIFDKVPWQKFTGA